MVEQVDTKLVEDLDAEEKEEDFEMIIPEFGICGAEAEGLGDDEETKAPGMVNNSKGQTAEEEPKEAHAEQPSAQQEEAKTPLKNACYKCKEKPAKF